MAQTVQTAALQVTRLGRATTYGDKVAAVKRLPGIKSALWAETEVKESTSQGLLVPSVTVLNKEWSGCKFESGDAVAYPEMCYVFASALCAPSSASGAGNFYFYPQIDKLDVPYSYSMEHGQDDACGQADGVVFDAFTLDGTRDVVKVSGTGFGGIFTDDATPTSSGVAFLNDDPIAANQVSIVVDDTYPTNPANKLLDVFHWTLAVSKRWGMKWTMDAGNPSFAGIVCLMPSIDLTIQLERNDQSKAFLDKMRLNATRYLTFTAAAADAAIPSSSGNALNDRLVIEVPFRVIKNGGEPKDEAGVYTMDWTLHPVQDTTFQNANENAWMTAFVACQMSGM